MALDEELLVETRRIMNLPWDIRDGRVVPDDASVALDGGGVRLDATFLYADLAGSTKLVSELSPNAAARVVRAYLSGACKIILADGGVITNFDGDRVMAVFVGDYKNNLAARCGLKINHFVEKILRPATAAQLGDLSQKGLHVGHGVGIDTSQVLVVRAGRRNNNDLTWVGRSANVAAILSEAKGERPIVVSEAVYERLNDESKLGGNPRQPMWTPVQVNLKGVQTTAYGSNWIWRP